MRAIPGYQVIHAMPDGQGQMVGVRPRLFRKIDRGEIVLRQIPDFRGHLKDPECTHRLQATLRSAGVAFADLLQNNR